MRIRHTDGADSDFIALCAELDVYLNALIGGEEYRAQYTPQNSFHDISHVFIAMENDVAVGCAAFKPLSGEVAEIKRVFTRPNFRGRGIAKDLLRRLEKEARMQGYVALVLETWQPLSAATALYAAIGYRKTENYGPYVDLPIAICMRKELV